MKKQQFELSIDHAVLLGAKQGFDVCLKRAIAKAIATGSNEGSTTMKVSFVIFEGVDEDTGEMYKTPIIKYRCGYSVPMKEGVEGTVAESCRVMKGKDEWLLVNGQIMMEELMAEDE